MALVYCFTNKVNNKKYIGMTTRTLKERIESHKYEAYNPNSLVYETPFKRAIRKYGIDGFKVEILFDNITREEAVKIEKELILKHQTYYKYKNSNGYNATIGGENISTPKDRVVQLNSKGNIVNIYSSVHEAESLYGRGIREHCEDLGKQGSPFGYYWLYEKDYLSLGESKEVEHFIMYNRMNCIVQLTPNGDFVKIWNSIGDINKETGLSIGNVSLVCLRKRCTTGGYVFMYYREYCDEGFMPKINNQNRSKRVLQFSKDGEFLREFSSLKEASKVTGSCITSISNVCNGKRKMCNGYIWEFAKNKEVFYELS